MPVASRVRLVPPEAWDEEKLLEAARGLPADPVALRPGDALGSLVVVGVEPAPGAKVADATEIEILPAPRARRAPLADLAILLDVSESMGDPWSAKLSRLDAAREAIASFLARPRPGVGDVTLLEYARDARVAAGPAPAASLRLPAASSPRGASRTATALDAALAHLAARGEPRRTQAIVLLTDGAGEAPQLRVAAQRAARLHVPVHVLVFAPEADEVFREVADATGGRVQRAAIPLDIDFIHEGAA